MSGFDFRPKVKDADYYLDAVTDILNRDVPDDARAVLRDFLLNEEEASSLNNEADVANIASRLRLHLL